MKYFIELPAVFSNSEYSANFAQDLVESGVKEESLTHIDNLLVNIDKIVSFNPTDDGKGCTLRMGLDDGAWKIAIPYKEIKELLIKAGVKIT